MRHITHYCLLCCFSMCTLYNFIEASEVQRVRFWTRQLSRDCPPFPVWQTNLARPQRQQLHLLLFRSSNKIMYCPLYVQIQPAGWMVQPAPFTVMYSWNFRFQFWNPCVTMASASANMASDWRYLLYHVSWLRPGNMIAKEWRFKWVNMQHTCVFKGIFWILTLFNVFVFLRLKEGSP